MEISAKENIISEIELLDSEQINELKTFLGFLKFRSFKKSNEIIGNEDTLKLYVYRESSEEDTILSECGMNEYNNGLLKEDKI